MGAGLCHQQGGGNAGSLHTYVPQSASPNPRPPNPTSDFRVYRCCTPIKGRKIKHG